MADTATGRGKILAGDQFDFTLDGLASAAQMERLIKAVSASLGGSNTGGLTGVRANIRKNSELNKKWQESVTGATQAAEDLAKAKELEAEQAKLAADEAKKFGGAFRSLLKGGKLKNSLEFLGTGPAKFALGISTAVGALTGYADKITEGLQRGISGGIFDYAIAAKTAGVDIENFSKAIAATDGGFASLASGATNGAKEFGILVGSVRQATADVGNLGMTNEQLAIFTAQQTKTAISQGFKGKAAQDVVIKNSRALGDELDTLANRTGKSVMELAAAAMKLAQDPIVANFVQTAKIGGAQVSKAVQQFGASLRGVFGEAGDTIASDALKTAFGNLPLVITQTGKNMINASSAVYSELERQAKIVKNGGDITAEDQERLRNTVIKEVEARGAELRMLANLEGAAGDGARQLLAMAEQANFYNSEAGAQRREEDKVAQEFNKSVRQLQANLQKLAIPFLALANTIDWGAFINALSAFADVISIPLKALNGLGEILGVKNAAGTVIGGFFGLASVLGLLIATKATYTRSVGYATMALQKFSASLMKNYGFSAGNVGGTPGKVGSKLASVSGTVGMGLLGAGAGAAITGGPQTGWGSGGSMLGGVSGAAGGQWAGKKAAEMVAKKVAAKVIGTALGGAIGSVLPFAGTAVGAVVGGILGQIAGDMIGGASGDLASVGSDGIGSGARTQEQILAELRAGNRMQEQNRNELVYGNAQAARGNALQEDNNRFARNNQFLIP